MASKTAQEELELMDVGGRDRNGGFGVGGFSPGGGGAGSAAPVLPERVYVTGMVLALAAIFMFFAALTSSYIVRKGLGNDWVWFGLPRILWLNTLVLAASSLTLERARRSLDREMVGSFRHWWRFTTALGLLFLVGQFIAWRQMVTAGVYLATNPSSSFFYLLTGSHGVHLLGGTVALLYVGWRGGRVENWPRRHAAVTVISIYWHFLDVLWVFLFLLLLLGR